MSQNSIANQAEEIRSLPDDVLVNAFQSALKFRLLVLSLLPPEQPTSSPESLQFVQCVGGVQ